MYCDRFEELFTKESPNELLIHIQSCKTCRDEYEKMLKTEKLIKEVKPYYFKLEKQKTYYRKIAASLTLIILTSFIAFNNFYVPKLSYEDSISSFPTDEYGLLDLR